MAMSPYRLAVLLHQLRNGLTPVAGYAALLSKKLADPGHREWAQRIEACAREMESTLNGLMAAATTEPAAEIDVNEILRGAGPPLPARLPAGAVREAVELFGGAMLTARRVDGEVRIEATGVTLAEDSMELAILKKIAERHRGRLEGSASTRALVLPG